MLVPNELPLDDGDAETAYTFTVQGLPDRLSFRTLQHLCCYLNLFDAILFAVVCFVVVFLVLVITFCWEGMMDDSRQDGWKCSCEPTTCACMILMWETERSLLRSQSKTTTTHHDRHQISVITLLVLVLFWQETIENLTQCCHLRHQATYFSSLTDKALSITFQKHTFLHEVSDT